ncbi:MAG: hypothetical protein ACD_12C00048G0001, partial [uncultured bacterium]
TSKLIKKTEKLYVYSSIDSYFSLDRFIEKTKKIIDDLEMKDNLILWSYFPVFIEYLGKLGEKLVVFDAVDNWTEHPSFSKLKERLRNNYKVIDEKADLIFTVSKELVELFQNKEKIHWIPNGIDAAHFQKEAKIISRDITNIKKPIIGYIGIIQDRVDTDILEYIAKKNPDKSLVLIGQTWPIFLRKFRKPTAEIQRLEKFPNVYFLGPKSYDEAPSYLQQFDLGIIPHKVDEFTRSMNPLKLYEYLACGLPVVTTSVSGAEVFENIIYTAHHKEEFNEKISQALSEDSEELRRKRKEIIKIHSWDKRIEEMLNYIMPLVNKKSL